MEIEREENELHSLSMASRVKGLPHAPPREEDVLSFEELGVVPWLVKNCVAMGIKRPTPIQHVCIPPTLEGKDVIGAAQTGSGKTAAFALPILQTLFHDPFGIYALVLTPTRELAHQIADQFNAFGATSGVRVCVITGGCNIIPQALELSNRPHVVIATPGRLIDHLQSTSTLKLNRVKFLVIDEADQLLDMGFADQIHTILDVLPAKRQTLLFSATMTPHLEKLEGLAMKRAIRFDIAPTQFSTVDTLVQEYLFMPLRVKDCYLVHVLREFPARSVIVFAASIHSCQLVFEILTQVKLDAVPLHSHLPQSKRLLSLTRFKSRQSQILVATDVASRGLDIPTVDLVINYDLPRDTKNYVHRVGRTARAGRGGHAISMITQYDVEMVHEIEGLIGKQLAQHQVDEEIVLQQLTEVSAATRIAKMRMTESGFLDRMKRRKQSKQRG